MWDLPISGTEPVFPVLAGGPFTIEPSEKPYLYFWTKFFCCLVTQSCPTLCDPWTATCQASMSFTVSWSLLKLMSFESGCHPTFSTSVVLLSSCLQSFPASGSFPKSQLFAAGGQSIRASALALILSMNIQDWFPLGLTELNSLKSKGLSKVFCNTTVWKHQFFCVQPSLWSNSHIHTWLLEKNHRSD